MEVVEEEGLPEDGKWVARAALILSWNCAV